MNVTPPVSFTYVVEGVLYTYIAQDHGKVHLQKNICKYISVDHTSVLQVRVLMCVIIYLCTR